MVPFLFGSAATARLEVYRLAIRAGFYTEWPAPTDAASAGTY
jgi:hypothetical protein